MTTLNSPNLQARDDLAATVHRIYAAQPVTDLHTHVFAPDFGANPQPDGLLLWGIDELVTYHYLIAEVFRIVPASELPYDTFYSWPKPRQADHIWKHLFVERTPVSEACRGVLTTLSKLGLDPNEKTLDSYRKWFSDQQPDSYIDRVMEIANVDLIVMTNEVFDDNERNKWLNDADALRGDSRFKTVLRIDLLLSDWDAACDRLTRWGYNVSADFLDHTIDETQRFLNDWIDRMQPAYVAMSLDPSFKYPDPDNTAGNVFIEDILMPVLRERNLAWAMMIGSRRAVNPALRVAGDMGQMADINSVVNLCAAFPDNSFLCTMLSRENQHELAVTARKFGNLFLFGCWWFLNNPSLIDQITRMRTELLGVSYAPQHSDARILDQLIYKWDHSRKIIANVMTDKYADLQATGYHVTEAMIERDARQLLRDNFREFVGV